MGVRPRCLLTAADLGPGGYAVRRLGLLNLKTADKSALAEGAGEYPLLTDGFTNVFKGSPGRRNATRGVRP